MKSYDDLGVRAVFWCDNCSIHNGINQLGEGSRHFFPFKNNQRIV